MSKLDCLYYLERNSVLDLIVLLIQITLILSDSFRKYSFFQNIFSDKLHKIVYTSIFFLQRYGGKSMIISPEYLNLVELSFQKGRITF